MSLKNHIEDEVDELDREDLIYLYNIIQRKLKQMKQMKHGFIIV